MGLKITKLEHTEDVYDFTVDGTHNFYANGVLVHNCEITLPTKPLNSFEDPNGVISLCTLSAINWGNVKQPSDFERMCTLAVRGLDALLSYQNYPVLAAYNSTMNFRPLGVGIINFAYFLAKNDVKYDESAFALVDEYAEAWSYYLIKASADLAKEQGACLLSHETKYGKGILPIDTYKKEVDELHQFVPKMPWEELRAQLKETGIRNATLMALMPSECQALDNEMRLRDGTVATLESVLREKAGIDIDAVHQAGMVGQRFLFQKPVELADSIAYECYYNGPEVVTEIEFEDGTTGRFTNNHQLLVNRGGIEQFVTVADLEEGDDVVQR